MKERRLASETDLFVVQGLKEAHEAAQAALRKGLSKPIDFPLTNEFRPKPGSQAKWGKRHLGHSKAMRCFDRCVEVQARRERNSLTRRARLLKAAKDLGLHQYINRAEIAQRVLEAKDEQNGNTFNALSAAERAELEVPKVRWAIPGVIPEGDLTICGGRPKVGKTRLAVAMAASVLKRTPFLHFPAPEHSRSVVLVTDDQADADTVQMLQALDLWDHDQLHWSRHFRLTERQINKLLAAIEANPGALVVIDSLRSVGRALQYGENDPEIGAILYDLKAAVIEAGGTLVLIHHCNKNADLVGVEALSGHSTIAGTANTVLTLHYVTDDRGFPVKDAHERRLVREARTGDGFDLIVSRTAGGGGFHGVSTYSQWRQQAETNAEERKRLKSLTKDQLAVLGVLEATNELLTLKQVCSALDRPDDGKQLRKVLNQLAAKELVITDKREKETRYRAFSHEAQIEEEQGEHGEHPVIARDLLVPLSG